MVDITIRKGVKEYMIIDLRKASKEELLNEWHKVRKELSKSLESVNSIEKFNLLKNSYLLPTFRFLQTLEKMIKKTEN